MKKVSYELLDIKDISLDLNNPRIAQYVEMYGDNITSEAISLALSATTGSVAASTYSSLKESIRVNGGLINPILINRDVNGKMVVIEGNTRLQIYKEFHEANPLGPWNQIIAIVYDELPDEEIHAIRLQSHLVGPRDWDPYSKAKYLYQLSEVDCMPMEKIISFCGGKKTEIKKLISAYITMNKYYSKAVEEAGMDFDPRDFSKFAEMQNGGVKNALLAHQYTEADFAKWVINQNVDTAQNVRKLPAVLSNKKAREEFLKSNISEAVKYIAKEEKGGKGLEAASMDELIIELTQRIRNIPYSEIKKLRNVSSSLDERTNILDLNDELTSLILDIEVTEDE